MIMITEAWTDHLKEHFLAAIGTKPTWTSAEVTAQFAASFAATADWAQAQGLLP